MDILIADDEPEVLESFNDALRGIDYVDVTPVSSGDEAIEALKKDKFDIVFTDLRMANGNGSDVIKYITSHALKTQIVVISAHDEMIEEYRKFDCVWVLEKPISMLSVTWIINKIKYGGGSCEKNVSCNECISCSTLPIFQECNNKIDDMIKLIKNNKRD